MASCMRRVFKTWDNLEKIYMVCIKGKWFKKLVNSPDYNYMGVVRVRMLAKVPVANLLEGLFWRGSML